MSYDASVTSTPFRLVSDGAYEQVIALIEEHMDEYPVSLVLSATPFGAEPGEYFLLEIESHYVGDSFSDRIDNLVNAMAPLVSDAFAVTLRNHDDPSDDSSTEYFGGPNPESIAALVAKIASDDAIEALGRAGLSARQVVLDWLLKQPGLVLPKPKAFAILDSGTLTEIISTHPMEVTLLDTFTDEVDEAQLRTITSSREGLGEFDAQMAVVGVTVDPERYAEMQAACDASPSDDGDSHGQARISDRS